MKIQEQDVERALQEAVSDGVKKARANIGAISNEINTSMEQNDADKCDYTVNIIAKLKVDKEQRRITATGGFTAPRGNMKEFAEKNEIPITDPDQLEMDLINGDTGEPIK